MIKQYQIVLYSDINPYETNILHVFMIFLQNYYPSRHQRGTQKYNISHWNFFSIRNCHISITFTYYIAKQHLKHYMDSKSLVNGSFIHLMKGDGLLQLKIIIIFLDIVMQMCDFAVIT